jgi:hypothetical protein
MSNICLWCRKDTSFGTGYLFPLGLMMKRAINALTVEIETIKECYLECEDCGEYTCEGNGECIDCGSEKLNEITEEEYDYNNRCSKKIR